MLRPDSPFAELATLWSADLELQDLAESTKQHYRDGLRLHVGLAMEHYTLAEIATGRVEWFLRSQWALFNQQGKLYRPLPGPSYFWQHLPVVRERVMLTV